MVVSKWTFRALFVKNKWLWLDAMKQSQMVHAFVWLFSLSLCSLTTHWVSCYVTCYETPYIHEERYIDILFLFHSTCFLLQQSLKRYLPVCSLIKYFKKIVQILALHINSTNIKIALLLISHGFALYLSNVVITRSLIHTFLAIHATLLPASLF